MALFIVIGQNDFFFFGVEDKHMCKEKAEI